MQWSADRTSTVARAGMLTAVACVLGVVEALLFPSFGIPGFKLGLANVAVVITLVTIGPAPALWVSLGRVALVSMVTGAFLGPGLAISLVAAVVSWFVMMVMSYSRSSFSVVGLCVGGAGAHSMAQMLVASLLLGTSAPLALVPFSLLAGVLAGLCTGLCAALLVSRLSAVSQATVRSTTRMNANGSALSG